MKQWIIKPKISQDLISKFPEINPVILQLLSDRGLKEQKKIDEFLYPDYSQDVHDPYHFSQMKKAVDRVYTARDKKEKVVIYGDYDADGVCGSAILARVLKKLGLNFEVYIPHRDTEGYGLNEKAINLLKDQLVNLIITVDCGVSNVSEINLAKELGIEVIITDHHHVPAKLPAALAIIHPQVDEKYPFKYLAGGGVAFKLAQAIIHDPRSKISQTSKEAMEKWLLDLVAISTIADMVPLLGENRTLVRHGLIVLARTKNLGLQKLIEVTGISHKKIDTYTIGFQLAPRINAAGRMAHANNAYQLLTTENIEEAITISHQLNKRNSERQQLTDKLIEEARNQLGEVKDDIPLLFAEGTGWSVGVIGLVSSKLTNEYARPSIVLSFDGEKYTASGRSIEEFDLIEAITNFEELLIRFGGHPGAAGFVIAKENLEEFKRKITDYAREKLAGIKFLPKIFIDLELFLKEINWELIKALNQFEPFGEDNFRPHFLIKNLQITRVEKVGLDEKHIRMMVKDNDLERKVICFGFGGDISKLKVNGRIDMVVEIGVNEWNGNQEIQLSLMDWKESV
ncbi:single-stranded-DNA-specific exonuclease RecJ [Patescibacteria group bacterium]|nr:single-stranded-DNA-specific exonuclease RecJ [Patescibacteria group bacterium]